jgi:hypothetical protein
MWPGFRACVASDQSGIWRGAEWPHQQLSSSSAPSTAEQQQCAITAEQQCACPLRGLRGGRCFKAGGERRHAPGAVPADASRDCVAASPAGMALHHCLGTCLDPRRRERQVAAWRGGRAPASIGARARTTHASHRPQRGRAAAPPWPPSRARAPLSGGSKRSSCGPCIAHPAKCTWWWRPAQLHRGRPVPRARRRSTSRSPALWAY